VGISKNCIVVMTDRSENAAFYPSGQAVPEAYVLPATQYYASPNSPLVMPSGQTPAFPPVFVNGGNHEYDKRENMYIPLQTFDNKIPSGSPPIPRNIKEILLEKDYEVEICKWFTDAWVLFKQNIPGFMLITVIQIVLIYISNVFGGLLAWPLSFGYFIASTHALRSGEYPKLRHMLGQGYLLFFPLFLITIVMGACIIAGFFFFIIPGIYIMIAFSFGSYVYLEYRPQNVRFWDSLMISMKMVNKHFFWITLFIICKLLLAASGLLFFGVGFLVTYPIACISVATAFNDIFGVNLDLNEEHSCVCC